MDDQLQDKLEKFFDKGGKFLPLTNIHVLKAVVGSSPQLAASFFSAFLPRVEGYEISEVFVVDAPPLESWEYGVVGPAIWARVRRRGRDGSEIEEDLCVESHEADPGADFLAQLMLRASRVLAAQLNEQSKGFHGVRPAYIISLVNGVIDALDGVKGYLHTYHMKHHKALYGVPQSLCFVIAEMGKFDKDLSDL